MKASEPLGLPRGTVRALIAIAFVGASVFLFVTGKTVPVELLTLTGIVVTFYYTTRVGEPPVEVGPEKPFIG